MLVGISDGIEAQLRYLRPLAFASYCSFNNCKVYEQ